MQQHDEPSPQHIDLPFGQTCHISMWDKGLPHILNKTVACYCIVEFSSSMNAPILAVSFASLF